MMPLIFNLRFFSILSLVFIAILSNAPASRAARVPTVGHQHHPRNIDGTLSISNPTLEAINTWRERHSTPALYWNTTMALYAARVSGNCSIPSAPSIYNQHIFSGGQNITAAIQCWYSEGNSYNYTQEPTAELLNTASAFTQLMWKSATQVGCAACDCTLGGGNAFRGIYLTCEYDSGNVAGQYVNNVLPPLIESGNHPYQCVNNITSPLPS